MMGRGPEKIKLWPVVDLKTQTGKTISLNAATNNTGPSIEFKKDPALFLPGGF
jgi:hypothetical protein